MHVREVKEISRALEILSNEKIMIDARFLPALELAERGEHMAWYEMQEAFASGIQGVPKHYRLARRYTDKIKGFTSGDPKPEIETCLNSASLEFDNGDFEKAKQELVQAVRVMCHHLSPEQWDFRVFDMLYKILNQTETFVAN